MPKLDVERVRDAAAGRWTELLARLGGFDAAILDGKNHPCPKCGGKDRFRLIDATAGAVLCNQCFSKKNGDGFAAVAWLTGCKFPEAVEKVAEACGVAAEKKGARDPAKDLEFREWNGALVPHFAARRPGVTEESLLAAGARFAKYKNKFTVFALPIIGETLETDRPVGWALVNAMGGTLPKYDRQGNHVGDVKVKITFGSKPGLVGAHAVERLKVASLPEIVWKVEGVSDLLALWAAIPAEMRDRHLVVTNANGAAEAPKWMASAIAVARPAVLHDADEPGEAGARQWALDVARQGVDATVVRLPYDVEPARGKDVRDWLGEGNKYDGLLDLLERGDVCRPKGADGPGEATQAEFPVQELILKRLQLEILYETRSGEVRVFSTHLRKSSTFPRIARLAKEDLLQAAGGPAHETISKDPDNQNTFSFDDIRQAIALVAAGRRGHSDDRGVGVWRGVDESGEPTDAILLVNDAEAARYNGEKVLRRVTRPRVDALVLDFGSGDGDWYDHDRLSGYVARASESAEWRGEAIQAAQDLFGRWRWKGRYDPELVTGLVMATWLQTVWAWRPQVVVIGESNCGKTTLFETLGGKSGRQGLFGGLALTGAKSSEAGVRQGVGNTGKVVLLDEFEKSKDRDAILQTIRASSRGDIIRKGTTGQKSVAFHLQHCCWLAAIESGMHRQPDQNRFVQLELLPAEKGKQGRLSAPSPSEAIDLGQRLLASSVVVAVEAHRLAIDLKRTAVEGAESRSIETYAVPAAVLGLALGFDRERTEELLRMLMSDVTDTDAEAVESDQETLLETIQGAIVRCDRGTSYSVAHLLESYRAGDAGSAYASHAKDLEQHGVAFLAEGVAFNKSLVIRHLLANTEWRGVRIDQVLMRLEGAQRTAVRMAGRPLRCVLIPYKAFPE